MIAGEHFDEEFLIFLAEGPAEKDTHPHLLDCTDCRSAVDEYRTVLTSFAEESTWDPHPLDETPNPQTIATLRAFADRMHREDDEAQPLVAELLAGPREEWMPRLLADSKYRTAGVVRKLIGGALQVAEESPKNYLEIATLAVEISVNLLSAEGDRDNDALCGAAWREKSYSFFLCGDIDEALRSAERARTRFHTARNAEHEMARLDLLCATLYSRTGDFAEASRACDNAENRFRAMNDDRKTVHALITRANVLAEDRRYEDALAVTARVLAEFDAHVDDHSRAALKCNEGSYWRQLDEPLAALRCLQDAQFIFQAIGARASSARVELSIAALLQSRGELSSAAGRLTRLMSEFEDLGMYSSAALAALFLAENRAAESRFDDVERLCNYAITQAKVSPTAYQERALTALGLLREAFVQKRASLRLVHRVRRYLEHLPQPPTVARLTPPPQLSLSSG
ncbi:MAG TPA: hypothetical protein VGR95_21705 [Thermoanaerobaculia bacterium]|nr:hypothetical protein [Thermoanaerobaculia bacterium]